MSDHYPRIQVDDSAPKSRYVIESLPQLAVVIVFGIFATTLAQPQALAKIPLQNLLKNTFHVSRGDMGSFFFLIGLFWYLKPIAGILSDAFPIFGTRRRHYLLITSLFAGVCWLGLVILPPTYNVLYWGSMIIGLFMVIMSTVTGAFLVEVGQGQQATGRLTAVRQVTYNFCGLIQGPVGGLLATSAFSIVAGVNAAIVVSVFPVAYFLLREKPAIQKSRPLQDSKAQILKMMGSGPFWLAIVFVALFYFAPGFSTLQFYRQQDILKIDTKTIGLLTAVSSFGAILASFAYGFAVKVIPMRPLLLFGVATAAAGTLFYLFYNNLTLAWGIDFQNGLFFGFCESAIIDLAARATPAGSEGLGYSCILAVRNLALFGADALGSNLADKLHIQWGTMVIINAATTAIVLILLPFMPAILMKAKDSAMPEPAPSL